MPRIRHSSNAGRVRARLLSTPTTEGHPMAATVAGIRFSDQLAALLDHAVAHGFRIEQRPSGKGKAQDVVALAPDRSKPPVIVAERGAKYSKAHYENIRRDLYRAGCPPFNGDSLGGPFQRSKGSLAIADLPVSPDGNPLVGSPKALTEALTGPDRDAMLSGVVRGLFAQGGDEIAHWGELAGDLIYALATNITSMNESMVNAAIEVGQEKAEDVVTEALEMASAAERERDALREAVKKADAAAEQARADCAAALERARVAEAKALEADRALAPLRAFLSSTEAGA